MHLTHVLLYTNQLENLRHFYAETLGLEVNGNGTESITVKIGPSLLEFRYHPESRYYHFAINIPFNQIDDALQWIKAKTAVLPFDGSEIVPFKSWNAEAVYFKDPAGNILEFIARKNLNETSDAPFGPASFQRISEIGVPVKSVSEVFENLHFIAKQDIYSGDLHRFCAVGNEYGLFILINPEEKKWIPEMVDARFFPLEVHFTNYKNETFHALLDENGWFKFV
ncbi:MAG: hypothetical protein KDC24_02795 [Saprospiraceae bacterium]|nr:hypothetical protein [Saprospiraceae bacterium]